MIYDPPVNIVARLAPAAAIETTLLQIPVSAKATIQGLTVCNRANINSSFRFSISPLGAATNARDYLYYDHPLLANDTFMSLINVDLGPNDIVRVYAGTAHLTFILFGGPR